jgi:hypothetical protein
MKITFGINANNALRVVFHAGAILFLVLIQFEYINKLERSQESFFMLRMSNVTSVKANLYCDIPYDNCRCSVISTKYCLTNKHLKAGRILPLVLFVLEVYLIRELVSLSGDHINVLAYVSWIASLFVFVGILIIIYRNTCYYSDIATILCCTGYLLFGFIALEVAHDKDRNLPSSTNNIMVNVQRSERLDNSV